MKRSRLVFAVILGVVAIADTFMQRVDGQAVGAPTVAPLAFVHATVVDGTGAGPKANQTVVVSQGQILVVGPFGSVSIPLVPASLMSLTSSSSRASGICMSILDTKGSTTCDCSSRTG